jgi:hypothetical protein
MPEGMNVDEAQRILTGLSSETELTKRLDWISEHFLARPYVAGPLGGGPDLPEVLRVSLDAFDCVTYKETVLALSLARTTDEFVDTIRRIRYVDGEIDWFHRNHYMVDWARNNERDGFVTNVTNGGPPTAQKTCRLEMIPGLPGKTVSLRYLPKTDLQLFDFIETGDLILFISEKETLDVFHTGLLIKHDEQVALRHATRKAGAVIEQNLVEFVNANGMLGFILLRPICRR